MSWQDLVFGAGSFGFALALVPSIRSRDKPALATCVYTTAVLGSFAAAYASLGLWLAGASALLTCAGWAALAAQRLRR